MKNIKDYYHLYFGAQLDGNVKLTAMRLHELLHDERDNVLLLRPLSEITFDEFTKTGFYDPDAIFRGQPEEQWKSFIQNRIDNKPYLACADDFAYLLKCGFDLFGLIDSKLVIQKE